MMLLTAFFGYEAQYLRIDASAETLLLENDKDLKLSRAVNERYAASDYLVVAFTPKDDLLSSSTISTIKNIKKAIGMIDGVKSTTTIIDVPLLMSPKKDINEIVRETKTLSSIGIDKKLVKDELMTSPLYSENLVSKDFKTTAIIVNLKPDQVYKKLLAKRNSFVDIKENRELSSTEQIEYIHAQESLKEYRASLKIKDHKLIEQVRFKLDTFRNEGDLFLGGAIMIADDMIGFVKSDIVIYGTAILLIMIFMFWIIFREIRFVVLPIFISIVALVITTGINAMLGLEVTVISSNYVAIQLITTLSLVVHLVVNYREEYLLNETLTQREILSITLERMSVPSVYVILTSVAGFSSLTMCDILPIIDLGIMMNIGVVISLLCVYIMFPAMMMYLSKSKPIMTFDNYFVLNKIFANIVERYSKMIIAIIVIIFVISFYGATKLMVENSFIDYFKKDTQIYKGMQKVDNKLGGTTPLEIVVQFPKADKVDKNRTKVSNEFDDFEEEFAITENDAQYWFTPDKMHTVLIIHNYLESLSEIGNVSSLGTLLKVGNELKNGNDLDSLELALMYNELSPEYKQILLSPYVSVKDNEVRFVARIIDSNPNLRRDDLIHKIQNDLEQKLGLNPNDYKLVGIMVLYNNMLQSLFDSQISTLGLALLLLGGMFLFLFRSLKVAILAIIVNLVPISVIFGIMGIFGIALDMMSITIASIALGITVDNTIHYYYRFRKELAQDGDYMASMHRSHDTIAFGMFYYSLVTIVGFLVLVTSNFIPTVTFGLLTVVALLVAIVSDLIFSPLLVVWFKPFGEVK
jgi:hypothetical protein